MMGMILGMFVQLSVSILLGSLQYAVMAYVVARCARMGWEAGKKK